MFRFLELHRKDLQKKTLIAPYQRAYKGISDNLSPYIIINYISFLRFEDVIKIAKQNDIKIRGYVSCVMGCPYDGDIDPLKVR
jgi:hypothetical protein